MALKAKLLLDSSDYNKKMDQAKAKAANTGKQIKDKLQQGGKGFEAINKFGGKFGGVLKNLTEGIAGLMSPLGLAMAGIAALGSLVVKWYDKMTQSAQQFKSRMEAMSAILKAENDQIDKSKRQTDELIAVLLRLQKIQALSNTEKVLAIQIIKKLTQKYGDLGIEIDEVTGKIKNFDDVQKNIKNIDNVKKVKKLAEIQYNAKQQADKKTEQMIDLIGQRYNEHGTVVYAYNREKYSNNIKNAKNAGINVLLNQSADFTYLGEEQLSEQQKELRKLWNEGGISGKMQFAKKMKQRYIGDQKAQDLFLELYKKLKQYQEAVNKTDNFQLYTATDSSELIKILNDETNISRRQQQQKKTKLDSLTNQQNAKRQQAYFKTLDTDERKIIFYQQKLNTERANGIDLQNKAKKILEEKNKLNDQLNKSNQKFTKATTENQRLSALQQAIEIQKKLNSLNAQENKLAVQKAESAGKQLQLELKIQELRDRSSKYYSSALSSMDDEIRIARMKLQGRNQQAEKQKMINDLKAKGLIIDQQQIDKILQKKRQLSALNLAQSMKNQGHDLVNQARRNAGLLQQSNRADALAKAEAEKGSPLTRRQRTKVITLADLQTQLNTQKYNFDKNLDIKTNEMTARGGFAYGAVGPSKYDVNDQIRDATRQSNRLLNNIITILQNGGII